MSNTTTTTVVIIPNNIKKTIKNIKEITKNHSEDDIYTMLKECSMDPNETTQRLLYLDTFHQVRSKRDKRNEVVKNRQGEDSRWNNRHQMRFTRGPRGNTSHYSSYDAGFRKSNFTPKERVDDMREKSFRKPTTTISKEIDTVMPPHEDNAFPISTNEPVKIPNGNLGDGPYSKPDRIDAHCSKEVIEKISTEVRAHIPAGSGQIMTESTSNSHPTHTDLKDVDGSQPSSSIVEQESCNSATVAQPNGLREFSVVDKHDVPTIISGVTPSSVQTVEALSGSEEVPPKLVKAKFFDSQHVIIPDHLQVPDAVKDVLSFGSINAGFSIGKNSIRTKNTKDLHSAGDAALNDATENLSSCYKDPVSAVMQADLTDNQQPQSHLHNENLPMDTKISLSSSNDKQLKEGNFSAAGPPFPIVQTPPNYFFGLIPPMLANTLAQPDGYDYQVRFSNSLNGDSPAVSTLSSTPSVTQSISVGQAAVTMPPQTIPLYQQLYPPSYIPYSHYFPSLYVPPGTMQFYGHTTFPQPLPTNNVLQPTPISAATMTNPPHVKPGANTGNPAPAGVSSGYGAYNSSQVSYSQNAALKFGNFSSSKDLMPSTLKEKNVYPRNQSEGTGVWIPTAVQDTGNFPVTSSLNFPQGQHVIYSLQPMAAPAPGHPLPQQSQLITGHAKSAGQHQQSHF